jgi:5-methylcytosine-specific restriction enzyme subunit McrC
MHSRTLGDFERKLTLAEYDEVRIPPEDLPDGLGDHIYENYSNEVSVTYPSPKTDGQWEFINQGYAGRVELPERWTLQLDPKVNLDNLFGMLEYAYDLVSAQFLEGVYDADSIEGFFDRVANILAQNVIRRSNEGYHKEYVEREEESTFVRGKIDVQRTARKPWKPEVHTQYRELTPNIEDNQILLWTLFRILSSNLSRPDTRKNVRRAYRSLANIADLQEFTASDCVGREYRRLNSDYEFMHALCRLILDNSGPTQDVGEHQMVPFTVEMPTLYERFVARWLRDHIPTDYGVESQKRVTLDHGTGLSFNIDLVITCGGDSVCVADTKYKDASVPSTEDVSQVVAYAEAVGTEEAFLVYPSDIRADFDLTVGDIRVRSLKFALDDDLEANGNEFREELLAALN